MNILILLAAATTAAAPPPSISQEVRHAIIAGDDNRSCGGVTVAKGALTEARFSGGPRPEVVVDYGKVACPTAPMSWTGSAGVILEVWSAQGGPLRSVMSDNVYGWRIRGVTLVTDQNGTICAGRNAENCRVTYVWDTDAKAMTAASAHRTALTLDEEAAAKFSTLKARIRAAALKTITGCPRPRIPDTALRPIGDATGDGRSEIALDYEQIECRGAGAAQWFSTGGGWTQVWSDHGGRLRPVWADNADWVDSRDRSLVTEEHAARCDAGGGPVYCRIVRRFDARTGRFKLVSRRLERDPLQDENR